MTFSLRLTADLALALAARAIVGKDGFPIILHLSPENNFNSAFASSATSSPQAEAAAFQSVAPVARYRSPIIWIRGSEPLDHPQIAWFSNALAASGRHVFVETYGASLKRRLHEFQPSSHFCFAIHFDSRKLSDDLQPATAEGSFRAGLEAIRMARLAGFFTCAHLLLHADTSARELQELHAKIHRLDVDGLLITPGKLTAELQEQVIQARQRWLPWRWALLSRLLDPSPARVQSRLSPELERSPLQEQEDGLVESAEVR